MTRVVRNAVLCVAGILVASAAFANVPDPTTTTTSNGTPGALGDVIAVSGHMNSGVNNGQPDICGGSEVPTVRCNPFTVTVRDFANNLIAGSVVQIDFSGCPDIFIACDQLNGVTGQSFAAGKKVLGTTNVNGQFTFKVQGAANSTTLPSGTTSAGTAAGVTCAVLTADGVTIKNLRVAAYDLNGGTGTVGQDTVNGADTSFNGREVANCLSNPATCKERTDTNMSGNVTGGDTARQAPMPNDIVGNTGAQKTDGPTGTYCP